MNETRNPCCKKDLRRLHIYTSPQGIKTLWCLGCYKTFNAPGVTSEHPDPLDTNRYVTYLEKSARASDEPTQAIIARIVDDSQHHLGPGETAQLHEHAIHLLGVLRNETPMQLATVIRAFEAHLRAENICMNVLKSVDAMKLSPVAAAFDLITEHIAAWVIYRGEIHLREARRLLDKMFSLRKEALPGSAQERVFDTMLQELAQLVEQAENWLPGDP